MTAVAYLVLRRRHAVHARAIRRRLAAGTGAWSDPLSIDDAMIDRCSPAYGEMMENGEWEQTATLTGVPDRTRGSYVVARKAP